MDRPDGECKTVLMRPLLKSGLLAAVALAFGIGAPSARVGDCSVDAMLVFDGSASMDEITFETGPKTRIVEASTCVSVRRPMPRGRSSRPSRPFGPMA